MTEQQEIRVRKQMAAIIADNCWTKAQREHLEELETCMMLLTRVNNLLERRVAVLERRMALLAQEEE